MQAQNSDVNPPRLPSCKQCRQRKVKCDSQRPRCGACVTLDNVCEFIDSSTNETFTGEYIHQLETEERNLQAALEQADQATPERSRTHRTESITTLPRRRRESDEGSQRKVQAGGISFLKLLFADTEWRQRNADLLQKFAQRPQILESTLSPNPLPEASDARILVDRYLGGTHVQNPFLLTRDVQAIFQRIYSSVSTTPHSRHDLFNMFMICALGSILPYRKGEHDKHPFGYYLAALEHFDQNFLGAGLRGIQDLLLVARFGIYHHIGTSIWDIAHICVRMCIEQGLHRKTRERVSPTQEQLHRRIFWHCYVIDRYSSTTLGRPFAIADQDITVAFPLRASDEELETFQGALDDFHPREGLSEMSAFISYIELRQITSRIHNVFNKLSKADAHPSALFLNGEIHVELYKFLRELAEWRRLAPVNSQPSCLYHRAEWWDFMHERYRLLLLRAAIDTAPKQNGLPSKELIEMTADSSRDLIFLYSGMFEKGNITFTRSYFQMLFTGGLSLMFSIAAMGHLGEFKLQTQSSAALQTCEDLLMQISLQLQDSGYYTAIFAALHRETVRRSSFVYQQYLTSSAPTRRGSQSGVDPLLQQYLDSQQTMRLPTDQLQPEASGLLPLQGIDNSQGQNGFFPTTQGIHGMANANTLPYPDVTYPQFDSFGGNPTGFQAMDNSMLQLGGFSEDWLNIEAGLGEYAYGENFPPMDIWDQLQLNGFQS